MKPVEEIARGLRDAAITKLLYMTRQECCGHGVGGDISSPPECCNTPNNLWQDSNAENALTVVAKAFDEAVAAALRAERERADAALTLVGIRTAAAHEALARAEKAEAERDEVLWDARFQIDAQVKSREAAESALATARNRALEEAAQARPVTPHGSPKSWEQGYADGTSEFADAILALRTKEPTT